MREVEHPGIPARMHGFGENQPAEASVVCGPANDNARLVRLATRGARNEILLCDVFEMREIVGWLQLHERFIEASRPLDLRGNRRDWRSNRSWRRRRCGAPLTALALSLSRIPAALALHGNRQLPE